MFPMFPVALAAFSLISSPALLLGTLSTRDELDKTSAELTRQAARSELLPNSHPYPTYRADFV